MSIDDDYIKDESLYEIDNNLNRNRDEFFSYQNATNVQYEKRRNIFLLFRILFLYLENSIHLDPNR